MTPDQIKAALKKYGSGRKAAEALGVPRTTFQDAVRRMEAGRLARREFIERRSDTRPRRGYVKRYILTAAQDQTPVVQPFWDNLLAYAKYLGAEVVVAGFTYNTRSADAAQFDECIRPYISNVQLDIGGRVLFCGEVNTSPTAALPLSGLETYTRAKWGVFPHPRVELRSIATMWGEPAKQIMTTGACTAPNYLPRKAGVKAEFHHVIGAVIVEIDGDGDVFCRHLLQDPATGGFYDLTDKVEGGEVKRSLSVSGITWGDLHAEEVDPTVAAASWVAEGNMLDTLCPEYQYIHDLADFTARNHHNIKDPHFRFKRFTAQAECVRAAIDLTANVLSRTLRPYSQTIVVASNHDLMLERWLREADYKDDPVNALYYLDAQCALYSAMAARDERFSIFEWAVRRALAERGDPADEVTFLRETDSFKVLNIEHAIHGHRGANGAKGHISSFARMGSKANVAHTHAAAIHEGIYQAGTSSKLDLYYNRGGLSSWNHAHIVDYANGKRTIVTVSNGKWRA